MHVRCRLASLVVTAGALMYVPSGVSQLAQLTQLVIQDLMKVEVITEGSSVQAKSMLNMSVCASF